MRRNPLTQIDFYKADHRRQYPDGTSFVYSNFTPRSDKYAPVLKDSFDHQVVFFGLQSFIKEELQELWQEGFFEKKKEDVVRKYKRRMDNALGKDAIDVSHIEALHDLGYLPLQIKALDEGERVPIGVPPITLANTDPRFFWLTNYLESVMSNYIWKPMVSATTAFEYKRLLTEFALKTGTDLSFVDIQGHDFSFRGMSGPEDAARSGAAHLTSFSGTDTVSSIDFVEDYYGANSDEEIVGGSVAATEHSVMSMGMQENELGTFRRLINVVYPKGIVSIVSDTWDFWQVVTTYASELKDDILKRDGKVVIRPDSGDPVKIICGDPSAEPGSPEYKGAVECLWETFGGTTTSTGHKLLDPHIGLIYGDSITLPRAKAILEGLAAKGFASGNVVFGIGSFTYQCVTRDAFGFAMKATAGEVNGDRREIFKRPKTDDGTKNSLRGLIRVEYENGRYVAYDRQTPEQEKWGRLKTVFLNGKLLKQHTLKEIRARLQNALTALLMPFKIAPALPTGSRTTKREPVLTAG
ncbi:MAG: nicotinate phosphoribosyltransferase [Alphaproteobacteria bacterium]|nr:nicotinate phosphoribosyltransferase [Alphaproteobacteria bacterium]